MSITCPPQVAGTSRVSPETAARPVPRNLVRLASLASVSLAFVFFGCAREGNEVTVLRGESRAVTADGEAMGFSGRRLSGPKLSSSLVDESWIVAGARWWDGSWHDTSPPACLARGSSSQPVEMGYSRLGGPGALRWWSGSSAWEPRMATPEARRLRNSVADAALRYARRGWPVFPLHGILAERCSCRRACPHPAKHPITRHGFRDATTDQAVIRSWWDRFAYANVGIATGGVSGIVVIDVDPASGGTESLAHLQALMGSLPVTLTARTGRGGQHLSFVHPDGELRNTAGRLPGIEESLPGLDLRGQGGYVVAPPSRHASGARYEWQDEEAPLAPTPSWLRGFPRPLRSPAERAGDEPGRGSGYAATALRSEAEAVRATLPGGRNARLNRAAFSLGTLVGGGGLLEAEVVTEVFVYAATEAGLGEGEARSSIRSGLRAGGQAPRRAPIRAENRKGGPVGEATSTPGALVSTVLSGSPGPVGRRHEGEQNDPCASASPSW